MKFSCTKCGACCRHLDYFAGEYDDLDRGDGICHYYDAGKKLCSIYDSRPLKCRIVESYEMNYKAVISEEEYFRMNNEGCNFLKQLEMKKE